MNMLPPTNMVPMVIDSSGRGERAYDIYSLLLKERIVFLGTPINDQIANLIVAQLLWLSSEDPNQPINLYINSPGGSVYAGLAIYDAMQMISAPVSTVAVGVTASMARCCLQRVHLAAVLPYHTPPSICILQAVEPRGIQKMCALPSVNKNAFKPSYSKL